MPFADDILSICCIVTVQILISDITGQPFATPDITVVHACGFLVCRVESVGYKSPDFTNLFAYIMVADITVCIQVILRDFRQTV